MESAPPSAGFTMSLQATAPAPGKLSKLHIKKGARRGSDHPRRGFVEHSRGAAGHDPKGPLCPGQRALRFPRPGSEALYWPGTAIAGGGPPRHRRKRSAANLKILPPEREQGPLDFEATAAATMAPGVTDDGSGTAAVMELARVMSELSVRQNHRVRRVRGLKKWD